MLKRIVSATLTIIMAAAMTTNVYAAENILDSISAGVAKKLSVSTDTGSNTIPQTAVKAAVKSASGT